MAQEEGIRRLRGELKQAEEGREILKKSGDTSADAGSEVSFCGRTPEAVLREVNVLAVESQAQGVLSLAEEAPQ